MGNYKVLKTAEANDLRYSMYDLINSVKKNDVIWRRDNPHFHNRELRQLAWNEVARAVYSSFDFCNQKDQEEIKATLLRRWKNARDSFLRCYRQKAAGKDGPKTKYIYEKELSFILTSRSDLKFENNDAEAYVPMPNIKKRRISDSSEQYTAQQFKEEHVYSSNSSEMFDEDTNWGNESTSFEVVSCPMTNLKATKNDGPEAGPEHAMHDEEQPCDNGNSVHVNPEIMSFKIVDHEPPQMMKTNAFMSTNSGMPHPHPNSGCSGKPSFKISRAYGNFTESKASAATQTDDLSSSSEADADQDFLNSMKPHMKRMDSDRKLDFQIEMLKLIKNFT